MRGDPTITVPTLDHGHVTITEPAWCAGLAHQFPVYRSDISHQGPDITVTVRTTEGPRELLTMALSQWPFATRPPRGTVYESVRLADGDHYPYDVAGLVALADDLVDAARRVRLVANRLAVENPLGGGR